MLRWLRFQRKYLIEFQEPYDAAADIKTFLEFSEEPAGQFLYEYEVRFSSTSALCEVGCLPAVLRCAETRCTAHRTCHPYFLVSLILLVCFPLLSLWQWFDAFPEQLTLLNCGHALRTYRRLYALEKIS